MSYIWEEPNRGKTLYDMAIIKQKALMEAGNPVTRTFSLKQNNEDAVKLLKEEVAKFPKEYNAKFDNDAAPTAISITFPNEEVYKRFTSESSPIYSRFLSAQPTEADKKQNSENSIADVLKSLDLPSDAKRELVTALTCLGHNMWLDGSKPEGDQVKVAEELKNDLHSGNAKELRERLLQIAEFCTKAGIRPNDGNTQLFKKTPEQLNITGKVQMPSMFDEAEVDDSMWNDMVVTEFGISMVNLSHPAVKKIIRSEHPEEDCPGDLKSFKKAIYGNDTLKAVFGNGDLERVILGKLTNLLTLGVAAATVDSGKRADRIIKELKEKGGHTMHRNLLMVKYGDLVNADPNNDSEIIKANAYCRSKKEFMGELDIPASAIHYFYSPVDPVKSPKIYLEMLANPKSDIKLESASDDRLPLVEGPANMAAKLMRKGGVGTVDPGKPSAPLGDKDQFKELEKKYAEYISAKGHPPFYVLKSKSDNKEVDVISTSGTGHLKASGAVRMVSMKIKDHEAAAFMRMEDIKKYFSV